MSKLHKEWRLMPEQPDLNERLSAKLNISKIISQVLINRGIQDEMTAKEFLYGGRQSLHDPFLLKDMAKAVARISEAKDKNEKIAIYGDYDVDGVTATSVIYITLLRLGINTERLIYYIPEREKEGYGLNLGALEKLNKSGVTLVVTVDSGISGVHEVSEAASYMDFIITDHHESPEILPKAVAIINPKQPKCSYPDKNLAGVGVAFKLCQALCRQFFQTDETVMDLLDIVAIGTVADIVPLTGENRILVKKGLLTLAKTEKIGLVKLLEECKVAKDKLDAGKIGFIIAPRLNAAGRIGKADTGVELLTTDDEKRAADLAVFLEQENLKRQELEKKILIMAEASLLENAWENSHVFVLSGEDWHPGVIGIVASRLLEKYYRPVIMISVGDKEAKGSCRSIAGFDIYQALNKCADLLIKYGGHRQAAGLSLKPENIPRLRERLNAIAQSELTEADYQPVLRIDSMVALEEVDTDFLKELNCLAPHGMGNPAPVFACKDVPLADVRTIGQDGRHLKLRVRKKNGVTDVLAWQMGELAENIQYQDMVDVAFVPEFNEWQGQRSIQLRAHDVALPKVTAYNAGIFCRVLKTKHPYREGMAWQDVETALTNLQICNKTYIDEKSAHNLSLKDMRGASQKLEYLLSSLAAGEKTILYVNTHKEACYLFEEISKAAPNIKDSIAVYSGILPVEWQKSILEWFSENKLSVIIATNLFIQKATDISQVIFWSVPVNRRLFEQQCLLSDFRAKSSIHLLFGQEDMAAARLVIESDLPGRTLIGYLYLVLKNCMAENRCFITDEELAERLKHMYQSDISIYGVQYGLTILEELSLVRHEGKGSKRKISLAPPPSKKLDIVSSPAFLKARQQKEDFEQFTEQMLHAASEEILSLLIKK